MKVLRGEIRTSLPAASAPVSERSQPKSTVAADQEASWHDAPSATPDKVLGKEGASSDDHRLLVNQRLDPTDLWPLQETPPGSQSTPLQSAVQRAHRFIDATARVRAREAVLSGAWVEEALLPSDRAVGPKVAQSHLDRALRNRGTAEAGLSGLSAAVDASLDSLAHGTCTRDELLDALAFAGTVGELKEAARTYTGDSIYGDPLKEPAELAALRVRAQAVLRNASIQELPARLGSEGRFELAAAAARVLRQAMLVLDVSNGFASGILEQRKRESHRYGLLAALANGNFSSASSCARALDGEVKEAGFGELADALLRHGTSQRRKPFTVPPEILRRLPAEDAADITAACGRARALFERPLPTPRALMDAGKSLLPPNLVAKLEALRDVERRYREVMELRLSHLQRARAAYETALSAGDSDTLEPLRQECELTEAAVLDLQAKYWQRPQEDDLVEEMLKVRRELMNPRRAGLSESEARLLAQSPVLREEVFEYACPGTLRETLYAAALLTRGRMFEGLELIDSANWDEVRRHDQNGQRASAANWEGTAYLGLRYLNEQETARLGAHEALGHFGEEAIAGAVEVMSAWVRERAESLEPVRMSELVPKASYRPNEFALKDKFLDPYVGKLYRTRAGQDTATEVLSMGSEWLVGFDEHDAARSMVQFALADLDHFALVLGVLTQ